MDHAIVLVVPNESAAFHGLDALKALDADGSLVLYAAQVVAKDAAGRVTIKETNREPSDALFASSMGALARLLAGASQVLAGPLVRGLVPNAPGVMPRDATTDRDPPLSFTEELPLSGFAGDFVHAAAVRLLPGHHAVCADVWEDWTDAVDMIATGLSGAVFRQSTDAVVIALIRASLAALEEEAAHVEVEIGLAMGEAKGILERKRVEIAEKQRLQRERLHERARRLEMTWAAKLESVRTKADAAEQDAKARHEAHLQKLVRVARERRASIRELFT
jgi:hypothetical protein